MTTARERIIHDLINDPICIALMKRDGVKRHEILTLMRTTKPLVAKGRSPRHPCTRPQDCEVSALGA